MRLLTKNSIFTWLFSLIFTLSTLGMPLSAHAGILAYIFGSPSVDASEGVSAGNSQTIALLEASVSPISNTKEEEKNEEELVGSTRANIADGTALVPDVSPLTALENGQDAGFLVDDISIYVVRKGDSLAQIAKMYGVSVDTILWANDLKKTSKISEGDILLILPVSGIKHIVKKGENLASIAKTYKVDINAITEVNDINPKDTLAIGDELIIPDAKMPTATSKPSSSSSSRTEYSTSGTPVFYSDATSANGYFINPVPDLKRRSQGFHGKNAVDLAAPTGTKILAAAAGRVILARTGYNGGYGIMIVIEHSNGTRTLYSHLSKLATKAGAQVMQGEVIGYVGSTGRSTGPHLHFEVHGAKNPGVDGSWKQ